MVTPVSTSLSISTVIVGDKLSLMTCQIMGMFEAIDQLRDPDPNIGVWLEYNEGLPYYPKAFLIDLNDPSFMQHLMEYVTLVLNLVCNDKEQRDLQDILLELLG